MVTRLRLARAPIYQPCPRPSPVNSPTCRRRALSRGCPGCPLEVGVSPRQRCPERYSVASPNRHGPRIQGMTDGVARNVEGAPHGRFDDRPLRGDGRERPGTGVLRRQQQHPALEHAAQAQLTICIAMTGGMMYVVFGTPGWLGQHVGTPVKIAAPAGSILLLVLQEAPGRTGTTSRAGRSNWRRCWGSGGTARGRHPESSPEEAS